MLYSLFWLNIDYLYHEGRVYVFDSAGELVAEHSEGASRINYSREHYLEGLSDKAFGDDLEEMAVRSLERLGAL